MEVGQSLISSNRLHDMVCPCTLRVNWGHLSPKTQLDRLNNALLTDPVGSLIEVDATNKKLDH